MQDKIITDGLGFPLEVTITIGEFEKLGSHVCYENAETGLVDAGTPHKINVKNVSDPADAAMIASHEVYHLFKSVKHLITADEEIQTECFGELVKIIVNLWAAYES